MHRVFDKLGVVSVAVTFPKQTASSLTTVSTSTQIASIREVTVDTMLLLQYWSPVNTRSNVSTLYKSVVGAGTEEFEKRTYIVHMREVLRLREVNCARAIDIWYCSQSDQCT